MISLNPLDVASGSDFELLASVDGSDSDLGRPSFAAMSEESLSDPEQTQSNTAVAGDVPRSKKRDWVPERRQAPVSPQPKKARLLVDERRPAPGQCTRIQEAVPHEKISPTPILRLVPNNDTHYLRKWLAARPNVKVVERVSITDVTAPDLGLTPLREMPRVPNRDFKATVTSKLVRVTWDPKEGDVVIPESMGIPQQGAALTKYNGR